ncbi:unnamed protein product [Prunus brigantina]
MNPVKNEPPSHIVPYPGHSPITVANRFSSLVDRIATYVYNDLPQVASSKKPSSSTSHSSLPIEGKTKAKLQEIARQLIIQASQMDDDDSPRSQSSTSQPNPSSSQKSPSQKPKRWADYEDGQDPYDLDSD